MFSVFDFKSRKDGRIIYKYIFIKTPAFELPITFKDPDTNTMSNITVSVSL